MPEPLAPHEALELHEVLRTEATSATKMQAMLPMVADDELRTIMQEMLPRKQARIQRLREFARSAVQ